LTGAVVAALGIFLMAAPLTRILFGAEYTVSIPLLRLLSWILIPFTSSTFLILSFIAANRERQVLIALMSGLITAILFNLLWTPSGGIMGAGWALLLSESVQAVVLLAQHKFLYGVPDEFPKPA